MPGKDRQMDLMAFMIGLALLHHRPGDIDCTTKVDPRHACAECGLPMTKKGWKANEIRKAMREKRKKPPRGLR